jgi:hypothetical protein
VITLRYATGKGGVDSSGNSDARGGLTVMVAARVRECGGEDSRRGRGEGRGGGARGGGAGAADKR